MVVMWSVHSFAVGTRGVGVSDFDGKRFPDQPFLVLKIATADEYLAQYREMFKREPPYELPAGLSYYWVSVD